ncbi:Y-family DNA polymerase [Aquabacterium sp. OR-4]|uniref:Y-family DNA polymerase n=1 Tax=Aquabacterium sp. OR-4 TaxID=2978127 RepID=UPI0028C8D084|nr:DNA polymerase Y family protein [Aquabacterium sp. OR-4]MDT7834913.1 DNA polymerase Y family protein [Aquabacterium sp. OR-4]
MLWVALHLPALSLESWQALTPSRGAQALLSAAPPPLRITQVDAQALAQGVLPGMTRATALALLPELQLGQADARRDAEALRAVAHVALAFSPSVSWATPADWRPGADEAAAAPPRPAACAALVGVRLEVQSCLRYHGGLASLLARLRAQLAPLGHQVRIATAPTALGAALLAAWRDDLAQGPHSTQPQALQPLLDALPLPLLVPDAVAAEALHAVGLRRVGDLAGLPRDGLARRFGPALLRDLDQARGQAPDAHTWLTLPAQFSSRLELFSRADTAAQVLHGAGVLLARLVAWLQARQVRAARFVLVMHHEPRHRRHERQAGEPPADRTELEIAPAQPSADARHLAVLLAERLGRLPLPAPALELSLQCAHSVAGSVPNGELFASPGSQREGLAQLVERLQARLGRAQVQRPVAQADRRPERGTAWLPADAARLHLADAADSAQADAASARLALPPQPLWLLPAPVPLLLRAQQPLHQGRPLQLLAGPERLETGWWDAGLALRDYFIARDTAGALLWIYRSRSPGRRPGGPSAAPADAAHRADQAPAAGPAGPGGAAQAAADEAWFLHGLFA